MFSADAATLTVIQPESKLTWVALVSQPQALVKNTLNTLVVLALSI